MMCPSYPFGDPTHNHSVWNSINSFQGESQGLVVRNSHNIEVNQIEVQGLLLVQAALLAAIEASIVVLGSDSDVQELQKIAQSLDASQLQHQSICIEDSDHITVNQTEVQIEVVVQAAIDLLARILLKLGD